MSDKTLDQLIVSLKTEAIDEAEKASAKIIEEANLRSQGILDAARTTRDTMISEAENEARAIKEKGESALRQAGRDYSISVRNEILQIFQSMLESEVKEAFSPDLIKEAIVKVVDNIGQDVTLKLPSPMTAEIAEYIQSRVTAPETLVTVIEDNSILNGFSVASSDEGWSYSITPSAVSEALNAHLNSNWLKILKTEA